MSCVLKHVRDLLFKSCLLRSLLHLHLKMNHLQTANSSWKLNLFFKANNIRNMIHLSFLLLQNKTQPPHTDRWRITAVTAVWQQCWTWHISCQSFSASSFQMTVCCCGSTLETQVMNVLDLRGQTRSLNLAVNTQINYSYPFHFSPPDKCPCRIRILLSKLGSWSQLLNDTKLNGLSNKNKFNFEISWQSNYFKPRTKRWSHFPSPPSMLSYRQSAPKQNTPTLNLI